jgi:glycosyltransferase involved in cell wall biosynthesis
MRILFITNNFPPVVDGVGDYTFMLAQYLIDHSCEVGIICSTKILNRTAAINNVKDIESSPLNTKPGKINLFPVIENWNPTALLTIGKVVQIFKPDIVSLQYVPYSFNHYGIPFSLVLLPVRIAPIKLSVTFHEAAIRYSFKTPKSIPIAFVQRIIANYLAFRSVASFTSISFYLGDFFIKKKPQLLPIGNNLKLRPTSNKRNFSKKEIMLCTFGTRDYELVLRSLGHIKKVGKIPFKYLILGNLSDEKRKKVEQLASELDLSERVTITGYLPGEVLLNYLEDSDIFIEITYPNYKMQGGTNLKSGSFAAAVAAGLPVLGFKGDMTDDVLRHGENIWFCRDSSIENIAGAILHLISSPDVREKLHYGAIDLHQRYLSWDIIGEKYLSTLRSCLS